MPKRKSLLPTGPVLATYLFGIRPIRLSDAPHYYLAVARAAASILSGRSKPVPDYLRRHIIVRARSLVFESRPGSIDLVMVALSAEPREVLAFFRPDPSSIVLDVGANIGGYSIRIAGGVNRVVAIEPEPSNYRQLLSHIEMNGIKNVTALKVAVSDQRGAHLLHLSEQSGSHSLEAESWAPSTGTIVVETVLLDDVVEQQNLKRIDWLKIDVERHELAVLRGADVTLSITNNLILEFELAHIGTVTEILSRHGLNIRWYDKVSANSYLLATRS